MNKVMAWAFTAIAFLSGAMIGHVLYDTAIWAITNESSFPSSYHASAFLGVALSLGIFGVVGRVLSDAQ